MRSVRIFLAGALIVLSHVLMSSAQGQGGWGGSSHSGQPGSNPNGQPSYAYGGVDANGVPYGGAGGHGGYYVNATDDHGRHYSYGGGQGGYGNQPGQPGQPGYSGTHSYANTNRPGNQHSSSASVYASAWGTFYAICLFSLFLVIKT